jgi:parallel beta-helix repeat protein
MEEMISNRVNQFPVINSEYAVQKIGSNSFNNILYVGGSGANNYSKIQDAINDARDNYTVFVYENSVPYYENIFIDKKINLIGENRSTTIIDGGGSRDVVYVSADKVNINGFTIQNSGRSWINAGVKLNSDCNNITGNIITNNEEGIYSYDLDNSIVSENVISNNNDSGIFIPFSSSNILSSNTIIGNNEYGIYIYDSILNNVSKNNISDNKYGIHLWFSFNIDIYGNKITNNRNGIQLYHRSKHNIIFGNSISDNIEYGISLSTSPENRVLENTLENNEYGIYFNCSSNNNISGNNIINNKYGINLSISPKSCVLENTLENNDYGIYFNCSSNNNISGNDITYNEYGVYSSHSSNNNISGNDITYNEYGVYSSHSSNNNINRNDLADNHNIGLYICFNSNYNKIYYNNFIDNHIPAYFEQSFLNHWKQNYWDEWNGTEPQRINGEIFLIGDLITLNWFNFDLRPVERPYKI